MKIKKDDSFDAFIKSRFEAMEYDGPIDSQLDRMSKTLDGKQFFKLSFKQFNFYYLVSFLFFINLFVVFFFGVGQKKSTVFQNDSIIDKSKDTLIIGKIDNNNKVSDTKSFRNNSGEQLKRRDDLTKGKETVYGGMSIESKKLTDTMHSIIQKQEYERPVEKIVDSIPVKKIRKIRYVNIRDTIIKMDTNKVKRRR